MGCGEVGKYLCVMCMNRVRNGKQVCPMCDEGSMWGVTHVKCRRRSGMEGLVKVFEYQGVMRRMVGKIKYKFVSDMMNELIEAVVSVGEFEPIGRGDWLVVGVPLHPSRERWRGFNQSELLAERIANYCGWEYGERVLIRLKNTRPQVGLMAEKRKENVVGAFTLSEKYQREILRPSGSPHLARSAQDEEFGLKSLPNSSSTGGRFVDRRVLLVDDVWTTGSTMRECAKVLKRAGVREVWGLVVAG